MNIIVAGTILERNGKILLIKENQSKDKGKWWIPAGGVDDGELHFDSEEISEAKWFTFDEIIAMKEELRNPAPILKCIEMLRNGNVLPLDTILKI